MSCINAVLITTASLLSPDCWQEQTSNKVYQQATEHFQPQLTSRQQQITDKLAAQQLPSTNIDNLTLLDFGGCGLIALPEAKPDAPSTYTLNLKTTTYRYRPLDHMIQYFQDWPEYRVVAYLE